MTNEKDLFEKPPVTTSPSAEVVSGETEEQEAKIIDGDKLMELFGDLKVAAKYSELEAAHNQGNFQSFSKWILAQKPNEQYFPSSYYDFEQKVKAYQKKEDYEKLKQYIERVYTEFERFVKSTEYYTFRETNAEALEALDEAEKAELRESNKLVRNAFEGVERMVEILTDLEKERGYQESHERILEQELQKASDGEEDGDIPRIIEMIKKKQAELKALKVEEEKAGSRPWFGRRRIEVYDNASDKRKKELREISGDIRDRKESIIKKRKKAEEAIEEAREEVNKNKQKIKQLEDEMKTLTRQYEDLPQWLRAELELLKEKWEEVKKMKKLRSDYPSSQQKQEYEKKDEQEKKTRDDNYWGIRRKGEAPITRNYDEKRKKLREEFDALVEQKIAQG